MSLITRLWQEFSTKIKVNFLQLRNLSRSNPFQIISDYRWDRSKIASNIMYFEEEQKLLDNMDLQIIYPITAYMTHVERHQYSSCKHKYYKLCTSHSCYQNKISRTVNRLTNNSLYCFKLKHLQEKCSARNTSISQSLVLFSLLNLCSPLEPCTSRAWTSKRRSAPLVVLLAVVMGLLESYVLAMLACYSSSQLSLSSFCGHLPSGTSTACQEGTTLEMLFYLLPIKCNTDFHMPPPLLPQLQSWGCVVNNWRFEGGDSQRWMGPSILYVHFIEGPTKPGMGPA